MQSALRHDPDPLLRLHLLSEGLIPNIPNSSVDESAGEGADGVNEALFVTTSCEELPFPWQRASSPQTRLAEAFGFLHAQPSADFYPFTSATAVREQPRTGLRRVARRIAGTARRTGATRCADADPLRRAGSADADRQRESGRGGDPRRAGRGRPLHRPLGARLRPERLRRARRLGVLRDDARSTVHAAARNIFSPTPIVPAKLSQVHAPKALPGNPGKTLAAALDTILDLQRQIIGATLQADGELPSGSSFGGLRGGYARLTSARAILKKLSFVSGVRISGSFPVSDGALQTATVRVSGSAASAGTITISPSDRVSGTLGGRHFSTSLAKIKLSRAGPGEWPSHAIEPPLGGPQELPGAHAR